MWNQVFSGTQGAPAQCFPAQPRAAAPYTTVATSPVTREAPYLYVNGAGDYNVFVPAARREHQRHELVERPDGGNVDPARPVLRRQTG